MQSPIDDAQWLRESADITLYSTAGRVIPPQEFAHRHRHLLAPSEDALLGAELEHLSNDPPEINRPLLRTPRLADGALTLAARRGGARSAYLPDRDFKIKACRPEETTFPHWELDENFELQVGEIPFGVMTRTGILRELLASCFEHHHGLPSTGRHLAVFEYGPEDGSMGAALLSHVPGDQRVELFIDTGDLTLHDVIRLARRGLLPGEEVELAGLSRQEFVRTKADRLLAYNFGGGFRGLLNSNIGNDVIRDGHLHSLCDFDTFRLLEVPQAGDDEAIRHFTLRAHVELIKSSLPFVTFLDLEGASRDEVHHALRTHYREHSTFFHEYTQGFRHRAEDLGWDPQIVAKAVDDAHSTPIAFELLQELVPNTWTASRVQVDSHYVPHN